MSTILTGALGTEDVNSSKQVRDVTPNLTYKYQELGPLTALMMRMKKGATAFNPKVEWHRNDLLPRWDSISAVSGASGATITVTPANVSYFKVGDVVEIPQLNPTSVQTNVGVVTTKTTTLVITAVGFQSNGATTAATFPTVSVGMKLHILNDSSEEYSQKPAMKVRQVENEWNYVTFLRAPYVIGNIQDDQKNYTGPERTQRKKETHDDIRIQYEENLLHGERYYRAGTNGRQYFARGFRRYIQQGDGDNIFDWSSGTFSEAQWDAYLTKGPCKSGIGGPVRFGYFSEDLYLRILEIGKAKERITGRTQILGQWFDVYSINGINLYMRIHHLLVEDYQGSGFIIDPTQARIRPYGTQGVFQFHPDIQENDRAGVADEWRILGSLEVSSVFPHGYIHK